MSVSSHTTDVSWAGKPVTSIPTGVGLQTDLLIGSGVNGLVVTGLN